LASIAPDDPFWNTLRRFTAARIGLPRSGASLATAALLDFKLAHARARDAVLAPFDQAGLVAALAGLGGAVLPVGSAAEDRRSYLMRPDFGRRLNAESAAMLAARRGDFDVAFVVVDGLSACAVASHAGAVLSRVLPALRGDGWRLAPLVVVRHGRVAIGDAVAVALGATCVAALIGERPGLSAPDSMGAYLTWRPHEGTTDAERNCISNIRPAGIDYEAAAFKLVHLLGAMRAGGLSGVALKDDSDRLPIGGQRGPTRRLD
jgi:ethanolamine ammonia-lyase small subunit